MIAALCLALAAPTHFVVVDRLLIAQLEGKRWKVVPESARSSKTLVLNEVKFAGKGGTLITKGFGKNEDVGGVFINTKNYEQGVWAHGLKASWPRKVKTLGTTSAPHLAALGNFLTSKGITTAPHLNAAWSVDLDGDGTQEVLLEGASEGFNEEKTANPAPGDYSVVLLRSVSKSGVKTSVLYAGFKHDMGLDFAQIRSIVDLDGDGRMEIVLSHDYYEGQAAALFTYRKGKLTKVAEVGAGV